MTIVRTPHCVGDQRADHIAGSHPLLQQVALAVNPFLDLPKPPTLPPSYNSLPTSLPPSALNVPPTASAPDMPAYVTSASGFAAHPSVIIAQNKALLAQLDKQRADAAAKVRAWEDSIKERELAEKRRKAPGWLDSETHLLEPERKGKGQVNLMDEPQPESETDSQVPNVDALGEAMDRAFGRIETG